MIADTLLSPGTGGDVIRVVAVTLGGVTFGMAVYLQARLKVLWTRWDLLAARLFIVVHLLVVLYVAGTLVEFRGHALTWRAPVALLIFAVKAIVLAVLHERMSERDLRADPPSRRTGDDP